MLSKSFEVNCAACGFLMSDLHCTGGRGIGGRQCSRGARDQGEEGENSERPENLLSIVLNPCYSRQATCKKAEVRQGKIYVGRLPVEDLSNQELTDHFGQVELSWLLE